ncbi:hypothetical protein IVB11_17755 [Bradyrhizobium sp. 177]|uniref:hypothetical protein n=1 Tax=Bradyrhizobium sp. 177 TaxID=2782647 RepID=UPI001FFAB12E|nr:hypothetical protein [Bradyrhizobium sp. 177]MCK1550850.1 hypothetical protein [Bradyrhizobium sp. 177]
MMANLANQGVVVLSQIAIVPLFISSWGLDGFGTWIVLTAIPTYVGLSDFGLSISAKSDMAIRAARGDLAGARETLSSVLALAAVSLTAFGTVYVIAIFGVNWTTVLSLHTIQESSAKLILAFGLVQIIFYQAFLFSATIIRAAGRPALESSLSALGRGGEVFTAAVVAALGGSLLVAACALACSRMVFSVVIWIIVARRYPELCPAARLVNWQRIKTLVAPSAAYAMMPIAQSIAVQGTTLAVSGFAGPAAAAAFNTTRVITRLGIQLGNTVSNTFVPYYSYAIGHKSGVVQLFKEHFLIIIVTLIGYLAFISLFGKAFLGIVSKWQIPFDGVLFGVLAAAASAEVVFGAVVAIQSAANRVGLLAGAYASLALMVAGASHVLGTQIGIEGVAWLILIANVAMLTVCGFQLGNSQSVLKTN